MAKKLYIFGAGAEKDLGFPLFKDLVLELYLYFENNKRLDDFLRKKTGTRFSYKSIVKDCSGLILKLLGNSGTEIIEKIKKSKDNSKETNEKKNLGVIITLLGQISKIKTAAHIDKKTLETIEKSEILKNYADNFEDVIDLKKISFSKNMQDLLTGLATFYVEEKKKK